MPPVGQVLGSSDSGYQRWPCDDIRELHRRRFELRECAVELFMGTGRTHLITFTSTEVSLLDIRRGQSIGPISTDVRSSTEAS